MIFSNDIDSFIQNLSARNGDLYVSVRLIKRKHF